MKSKYEWFGFITLILAILVIYFGQKMGDWGGVIVIPVFYTLLTLFPINWMLSRRSKRKELGLEQKFKLWELSIFTLFSGFLAIGVLGSLFIYASNILF